MKKFKYPLVIKGTPAQLREIREELLKLGHKESDYVNRISETTLYTVTQYYNHGMDHFSSGVEWANGGGSEYGQVVSADNRDLVLALAAMVDSVEGYKGEAYVCTERGLYSFTNGRVYFLLKDDLESTCAFTDDKGDANGHAGQNHKFFRKATKEEIINHFKKQPMTLTGAENGVTPEPKRMVWPVSEDFIKEAHAAACTTWKKKIEAELPDLFKKYSVGQRFKWSRYNNQEYILAQVSEGGVTLISLRDGNRYREAVKVDHPRAITPREFSEISGDEFTQI